MKIDMWYGDSNRDCDKNDICFSDCDCVYRGHIYKDGRIIGDYTCDDCLKLEKAFPHLVFNWR